MIPIISAPSLKVSSICPLFGEGLDCGGGVDDHPPETTKADLMADGLTKDISPGRGAVESSPKSWRRLLSFSDQ